jgi:phenylacetate-CoA ligase
LIRGPSRKQLWENTPPRLKALLGVGLRRIPPEVWFGRRYRETAHLVRASDKWPAEKARTYTLERVREICDHAYRHSPYYQRTWRSIGFEPGDLRSLEDLAQIPCLDVDTVRAHRDEMRCRPHRDRVELVSTGGTGGRPLQFHINADRSPIEAGHLITHWSRAGYRPEIPLAVLRGRVVQPSASGLRHIYDPLLRHHHYSNFHMDDASMGAYLRHIANIGECFLHVYPSSAAMLARFARRTEFPIPKNVRGILAESEATSEEQRKLVEEVFGCRYFSSYGQTEKVIAGAECEHGSHLHVSPTYGHFELLDQKGEMVNRPGERGEIVGTGFINTVTPFIRYKTGDFATLVADRCDACGREQTLIDDVRGRRQTEFLVARDGSLISWTSLNMHDDTFDNVLRFRFRQEEPGRAKLLVVPGPRLSEVDERRISHNLAIKLDGSVAVEIERCDSIALSPAGKTLYVDQRIEWVPDREGTACDE